MLNAWLRNYSAETRRNTAVVAEGRTMRNDDAGHTDMTIVLVNLDGGASGRPVC